MTKLPLLTPECIKIQSWSQTSQAWSFSKRFDDFFPHKVSTIFIRECLITANEFINPPQHTINLWRSKLNQLITVSSPHYSDMLFRCFLTKNMMDFMQVKKLRPPLASKSPFLSLEAQLLQYRKTRPAASRRVKRTHRGQGRPQFFNLHKIHIIFC